MFFALCCENQDMLHCLFSNYSRGDKVIAMSPIEGAYQWSLTKKLAAPNMRAINEAIQKAAVRANASKCLAVYMNHVIRTTYLGPDKVDWCTRYPMIPVGANRQVLTTPRRMLAQQTLTLE